MEGGGVCEDLANTGHLLIGLAQLFEAPASERSTAIVVATNIVTKVSAGTLGTIVRNRDFTDAVLRGFDDSLVEVVTRLAATRDPRFIAAAHAHPPTAAIVAEVRGALAAEEVAELVSRDLFVEESEDPR